MVNHDATGAYRAEARATLVLAVVMLAWVATLAAARLGPELVWDPEQRIASWVAIAVNLAVGIAVIIAFVRFLARADELNRKIMLEALSVTFGIAWVGGFGYIAANAAGLLELDVALLLAAPGVIFTVAVVVGRIRYR